MEVIYMIIFFEKFKRRPYILSKTIICFVLIYTIIVCSIIKGHHERVMANDFDISNLYAISATVMDGYTNRVLISKNSYEPLPNASTTKIMTAIVTLEKCDLSEVVLISENAASQPKVRMGLTVGESYSLQELIYGLMLESYNDCAVAIAEHVSGNTENFAKLMNDKAKEIGCIDTYFVTPNGLDKDENGKGHHTTSADLCRIMNYCVWQSPKAKEFLEITQTKKYGDFVNHNQILGENGVISGKTGYTAKAGYCYICGVESEGKKYSIALLGCGWPEHKDYKWKDVEKLIEYIEKNYKVYNIKNLIEKKKTTIKEAYKQDSDLSDWKQDINYFAEPKYENSENELMYLAKKDDNIKVDYKLKDNGIIFAQKYEKEKDIGICRVEINDFIINENKLYINVDIIPWNYSQLFKCVFVNFISKK